MTAPPALLRLALLVFAAAAGGCASTIPPSLSGFSKHPAESAARAARWTAPETSAGPAEPGWIDALDDAGLSEFAQAAWTEAYARGEADARLAAAAAAERAALAAAAPSAQLSSSATGSSSPGLSGSVRTDSRSSGIDAAWELSLAKLSALRGAGARASAAAHAARGLREDFAAETASGWIALRSARCAEAAAERLVDLRGRALELERSRWNAGFTRRASFGSETAVLEAARAELQSRSSLAATSRNKLAALSSPGTDRLAELLAEPGGCFAGSLPAAPGWSVESLLSRPDVAEARSKLDAALFDAKTAGFALAPSVKLGASWASVAASTAGMGPAGIAATLMAGAFSSILDPKVWADGAVKDAAAASAASAYRKAVESAARDAADALANYSSAAASAESAESAREHARRLADDQRALFEAGLASASDRIAAEASSASAEASAAAARAAALAGWIALAKASGASAWPLEGTPR